MKYAFVLLGCIVLSACMTMGGYKSVAMNYKVYTKDATYEKIQAQMQACGLPLNDPDKTKLYAMTDAAYVSAKVCMEKHGYRSGKDSICRSTVGEIAGGDLCKEWLKEFKPCYLFCDGSPYEETDTGKQIIPAEDGSDDQEALYKSNELKGKAIMEMQQQQQLQNQSNSNMNQLLGNTKINTPMIAPPTPSARVQSLQQYIRRK